MENIEMQRLINELVAQNVKSVIQQLQFELNEQRELRKTVTNVIDEKIKLTENKIKLMIEKLESVEH